MGDLYASPADPIFYRESGLTPQICGILHEMGTELTAKVHHANLDRVWWSWQSYDLESRLRDISGPIFLMDYDNVQGGNVTLDFEMTLGVSGPNVTVGDVMDISNGAGNGVLCYTYDSLYDLQA